MSIDQLKETIHLRIEQADDKMLRVFAQFVETMFSEYQPEAFADKVNVSSDKLKTSLPAPLWAKAMTKEESLADIREGLEEYHRGEYKALDELEKGFAE